MPEPLNPEQAFTPRDIERLLATLFNETAVAELRMRDLLDHELDAKLAYEKAHLIASTDPSCPKVERGGYTVAERDDWVRGVENDEYEAYEMAKVAVKMQQRYMDRLEKQVSMVQTISKHVLQAMSLPGSVVGSGAY